MTSRSQEPIPQLPQGASVPEADWSYERLAEVRQAAAKVKDSGFAWTQTELVGRSAYQQVADDLRQKMAAGELAVGAAIPSTAQMTRQYGVSSTVVRAAVSQLRAEGLLVGQPGKGVFVRAVPGVAPGRAVTLDGLARQVAELRETGSAGEGRAAEVAALRDRVSVIERHLAGLYQRIGLPVPDELAAEAPDASYGH